MSRPADRKYGLSTIRSAPAAFSLRTELPEGVVAGAEFGGEHDVDGPVQERREFDGATAGVAVGTRVGRADGAEKYAVILAQARFARRSARAPVGECEPITGVWTRACPGRALSTTIAGRSIFGMESLGEKQRDTTQSPDGRSPCRWPDR